MGLNARAAMDRGGRDPGAGRRVPRAADAGATRAAYLYDYMPADHLDSLAAAGFNRALIHALPDLFDAGGAARLRALVDPVSPQASRSCPSGCCSRITPGHPPGGAPYTWGRGVVEPRRRARSTRPTGAARCSIAPERRWPPTGAYAPMAVDLELLGAGRHHTMPGRALSVCVAEHAHGRGAAARDPARLSGLLPYEEAPGWPHSRRAARRAPARHPGVELAVLDSTSLVRAPRAGALARAQRGATPTTPRARTGGAAAMADARAQARATRVDRFAAGRRVWLPEALLTRGARRRRSAACAPPADGYFRVHHVQPVASRAARRTDPICCSARRSTTGARCTTRTQRRDGA